MGLSPQVMLQSGILEEFWPLTMDNFTGDSRVRDVAETYIKHLANARENGIGIIFYGSNGTGKTMLGVEILKAALREKYTAQFASLGGIIQLLSDGWFDKETRQSYTERIRDIDFLMVDDVGKEYRSSKSGLTEIAFDNLFRYRSFRNKPIILTTNSDMASISSVYGNSLTSLMQGKLIPCKVIGDDYRKTHLSGTILDRLCGRAK